MKNALIITGGDVDIEFAKDYYEKNEFSLLIVADGGLKIADKIGIIPDYIVGDFDSVSPLLLFKYENMENVVIKRYKPEKDFTDTYIAMMTAVEENSFEIHILGGTGSRLDHTLANIQLLQMALQVGIEAVIASEKNRIRLLGKKRKSIVIKKENYRYVSLIPLSPLVSKVTTKGMKYDVSEKDFSIESNISLGVSNEILDEEAEVSIESGTLIMIEAND